MGSSKVNWILAFAVFLCMLLLIELGCLIINRSNGSKLPYLYIRTVKYQQNPDNQIYRTIDPLLGYTYTPKDALSTTFSIPAVFSEGFVYYNTQQENLENGSLERPIIVTLGGSTTEPFHSGLGSWPEEMASMMKKASIKGTVVNGGVGGYSSNQELIKLQRDVLELSPDIVITYHGVNDVRWVDFPHPMASRYLTDILEKTIQRNSSTFFPNSVFLARSIFAADSSTVPSLSKGVAVKKSHAENFVKNTRLMSASLKEWGIEHVSILQPFALTGQYAQRLQKRYPEFYDTIVAEDITLPMYRELLDMARSGNLPMVDFTTIFDSLPDSQDNVYIDRCHLRREGNVFLAEKILGLLTNRNLIP